MHDCIRSLLAVNNELKDELILRKRVREVRKCHGCKNDSPSKSAYLQLNTCVKCFNESCEVKYQDLTLKCKDGK